MSGTTRTVIDEFLAQKRIAFIGVSREPQDFSRLLFREMLTRGYDLVPVHPVVDEIEGRPTVRNLGQIQPPPDGVLVMTPMQTSRAIAEECAALGIKRIWLYRSVGDGSVTPEAVETCRRHGIQVVAGECPFMYFHGAGWIHALHRGLRTLIGTMPR